MIRNWLGKTIARKLLLAFFLIFFITYLATALVVQSAVRSAVTDSELAALSQMARLNLGNLNARFEQLATDLHAWTQLDVMNDLVSGDVDKRIARTLENLKHDYALKGDIYAFDRLGQLVASSNGQHKSGTLPDAWKPRGKTSFVNKHPNPLGEGDIIALTAPIAAAFSKKYQLGALVIAYPIKEVGAALSGQTLLYYHQDSSTPEEVASGAQKQNRLPVATAHRDTLLLSTLDAPLPNELLTGFAHNEGWLQIGNQQYLVNSASENTGLLSGWRVVMLREPEELHQTVRTAIMKLAALCLILTLPLIIAIRWLAAKLTAPLRDLTQFVSAIGKTSDLSRRLELHSEDEIGVLAASFNLMAERLESGSRARHESETRLRATIDNALDAVVQMDSGGFIIGWNDQATSIFGWPSSEVIGRPLHEVIIPTQYREAHVQGLKRFLHSGNGHVLNTRLDMMGLHRDGHEFPIELSIASIMMGERYEFSGFIRDITDKKKNEEMIWRQANFDKVTCLPNRHMLHDRLTREIKKAHRAGLQIAILFIDLDHFKEINDTLGHDMGDALLIEASCRIKGCIRDSDTVARLGGDEFTVIMPEVFEAKSVNRCAQRILKVLAEPFQLGEEMMYISASIGITLYPNDATTVENLLKNADQAMYAAKSQGRNQLCYFTVALQEIAQNRRRLTHDLREALAASQFKVYFQPIVDLTTGRINKAEALIRWQHPERGWVSPLEFIQIAEETGLITRIGDWVFKEAAQWAKHWSEQFSDDFQVSVNVSPVQFQSEELSCQAWGSHLQAIGITGQNIVIEITEGLLLKAATNITNKLLQFRDLGTQVAIDDFGTGYSSLAYLKKFDIDYLKIDKSFVDNLEADMNDMALSEAIIVMAHKLGLKVIAEGVETEVQRKILAAAGCDYAQGYLFSKPVPPEAFEELLRTSMALDADRR